MQLLDALNLCTFVFAGGDAFEVDNAEVQPLLQPDAIHDADHLKSQHVLPQVLSHLKHTPNHTNALVSSHFSHQGALCSDEEHGNNRCYRF